MLSEGARQLPMRHLSIRVPWNDTDWTGRVCRHPRENLSCLILGRIREARDDEQEEALAGRSWKDMGQEKLPPCVGERGGFMAPYSLERSVVHPYAENSRAHGHLAPTPFRYPPYSAPCVPFLWMLRESAALKAQELELGFRQDVEDHVEEIMGFKTQWVQEKHNQLVMLNTFFSAVEPDRSLCFFYAKRIPLVEDNRRVLIGVGWIKHVAEAVEYNYSGPGELKSIIWERPVLHSIRPSMTDGFLLPYQEIRAYLEEHPEEDPSRFVAFVPDEQFEAFSYATEHVSNDGAIASLLSCARALRAVRDAIPGPWERVLQWIDHRLGELWAMRGPCPGLGAALTAFGVQRGILLAYELEGFMASTGSAGSNPWPVVDRLFRDPSDFEQAVKVSIGATLRKKWEALPDERRALLKLLSRFELTPDQATRFYVHEEKRRQELHIAVSDSELLANPYLLYELDWMAPDPIQLGTIDRGLFPDASLRQAHPIPAPSALDDATDARRVQAFAVSRLRAAAQNGDTLLPRPRLIQEIRELEVQPACPVDGDLMNIVEEAFSPAITTVQMKEDVPAYQLTRLHETGAVIRRAVLKRIKGRRREADIDWRRALDEALDGPAPEDDELEKAARQEKVAALKELFASRLSVLIGPAGTGKTTLLQVLCDAPEVERGGILLLAPTGKARVRMETQTRIRGAQTIAQFLYDKDRYYAETSIYRLSDSPKVRVGQTVIIDEASMLTEPQLAALLDALEGVQRLILVGDPRQLPPIGAGRPFLDIVTQLTPGDIDERFPRVGSGYAELTISRRHMGEEREDLLLADWFSGRPVDAGADEIWAKLGTGEASGHVRAVRWDTVSELQEKLLECLEQELQLEGHEDWLHFEQSLGATEHGGYNYFWAKRDAMHGGASSKAEDWQILSPVRNAPHGVDFINRMIQQTFRKRTLAWATKRYRRIPKPMGPQGILYGDKVINVRNHRHGDVWPKDYEGNPALRYVANGEIGIVVGQFKGKKVRYKGSPRKLEVEFSTQQGFKYGYGSGQFGEESDPPLQLAYALTIHKAQGSEFGTTFVILPNPCRLLQRELLYTALTRQRDKVILLHQGDLHTLKEYADDYHSEAARRLTNLFHSPELVPIQDQHLDERHIHVTRRGDCVRSKSEVIIADMLYAKQVAYEYEAPLQGSDGQLRYPDFTIIDDESGQTIYWEHLGMLGVRSYRERWQRKLAWYREQGILPYKEGGGPAGALITTRDDARGGIDSAQIEALIDEVLGL